MASRKVQIAGEDGRVWKSRHGTQTESNMMARRAFYNANPGYSPAEKLADFLEKRAKLIEER